MPIEKQKEKLLNIKQKPVKHSPSVKKTVSVSPRTALLKYLISWRKEAAKSIGNKQKLRTALLKQAKVKNANYWSKGGIAWFLRNYSDDPDDAIDAAIAAIEAKDSRLAYALGTIVIDDSAPLDLRKKAAEALLKISPDRMANAYELLGKTIENDLRLKNHINRLLLSGEKKVVRK